VTSSSRGATSRDASGSPGNACNSLPHVDAFPDRSLRSVRSPSGDGGTFPTGRPCRAVACKGASAQADRRGRTTARWNSSSYSGRRGRTVSALWSQASQDWLAVCELRGVLSRSRCRQDRRPAFPRRTSSTASEGRSPSGRRRVLGRFANRVAGGGEGRGAQAGDRRRRNARAEHLALLPGLLRERDYRLIWTADRGIWAGHDGRRERGIHGRPAADALGGGRKPGT
jgi:hypothetical protein